MNRKLMRILHHLFNTLLATGACLALLSWLPARVGPALPAPQDPYPQWRQERRPVTEQEHQAVRDSLHALLTAYPEGDVMTLHTLAVEAICPLRSWEYVRLPAGSIERSGTWRDIEP